MIFDRGTAEPIRSGLTWAERWQGEDDGLITAWERGREFSLERPDLSVAARLGELIELPWKGGVSGDTKVRKKFGSLLYYAMWLGLRGEPLRLDSAVETRVCCARSGVVVVFTADAAKFQGV